MRCVRRRDIGARASEGPDGAEVPKGYLLRLAVASLLCVLLTIVGAIVAVMRGLVWAAPLFAMGFAFILVLVARNKKFRHASPTLRRVIDLADAGLTSLLIGGILILANTLAFSYAERPLDMTSEGSYTLSSQSENAIKNLKRPLEFTVFMANRNASARVQQLLGVYKSINPAKVKVETIERFREQDRIKFDELRKRVPDVAITQGGGVVVDYGEGRAAQTVVVRDSDLFQRSDQAAAGRDESKFESVFRGEDVLTSAIIRLERGKRTKIAFTTGHGEPPLDAAEPNQPGLGLLRTRLESTGFEVVGISLLGEDVPQEIGLVVVSGPLKKPFATIEANRLQAFAARGGNSWSLPADKRALDWTTYSRALTSRSTDA